MKCVNNLKKNLTSDRICLCLEEYIKQLSFKGHCHFIRQEIVTIPRCGSQNHHFFEEIVFDNMMKDNVSDMVLFDETSFFAKHDVIFSEKSFIRNINNNEYKNFKTKRRYSSVYNKEPNSHIYELLLQDDYLEVSCNCDKEIIEKLLKYDFNHKEFKKYLIFLFGNDSFNLKIQIIDSFFSVFCLNIKIKKNKVYCEIHDGFYNI